MARRSFKYAKWNNFSAQLSYYINVKYWMPKSRIMVRPNAAQNGLIVVLVGLDITWQTECIIV